MKNKYEEFYLKNDKNYPISVYWDLYDKDSNKAIEKYEGHIFCPSCHAAPLTVAKGNMRRYFKVAASNMDMHDEHCPYRLEQANKKGTNGFYKDLAQRDINNLLVRCMNMMFKSKSGDSYTIKTNAQTKVENGFITICNNIKLYEFYVIIGLIFVLLIQFIELLQFVQTVQKKHAIVV